MAIWVDRPMWPRHGTLFAHLVSDTSYAQLHHFAESAGLPPRSFHGDHYDVPQQRYAAVVEAGATAVSGAELVHLLASSGLRLRKRRGDQPVTRIPSLVLPGGVHAAVDLVVAERPVTVPGVVAAMAFVQDRQGSFVLVHTPSRGSWGSPGGWREAGESVAQTAAREVREETGLVVPVEALQPCAYERLETDGEVTGRWRAGRSYLQVFRTRVDQVAPPVQPRESDVDAARWVDRTELERLCGEQFWWPLVPRLFPLD